jgi:hypothetical protein
MLRHWNKLLNTDCVVIDIGEHTIYPIFKVGSSTLMSVADKSYRNGEISRCGHIDIFLRDPGDRFVTGLNEYCRHNNLDVEDTWELVEQGKLIDRHFAPQYIWLLHLYKFYKGMVTLRPFKHIKKITKVHKNKNTRNKVNVALLRPFVEVDYQLMESINQTVDLGSIVRRHKNVLS